MGGLMLGYGLMALLDHGITIELIAGRRLNEALCNTEDTNGASLERTRITAQLFYIARLP